MNSTASSNPFKGVNRVCAQCVRDCKQYANVILEQCPKFHAIRAKTPNPNRRMKSSKTKNKAVKIAGSISSLPQRGKGL